MITGGDPLNSTFRSRLTRFVGKVISAFSTPPAPAQDRVAAALAQGAGRIFNRLDELRTAPQVPGAPPPTVAGAGWPMFMDPVLRTDEEQQAIWGSKEAKYGRVTTSYGVTPQAYSTYTATDLTLERIAEVHREVDQAGLLFRKADLDFSVNRRDSHIQASHRARIAPLYKTQLQVAPRNRTPLAWALAAFVRSRIEAIPSFSKAEEDLSGAAAHGYAGLEVVWQPPQDVAVPVSSRRTVAVKGVKGVAALEWIHPRDFRWRPIYRRAALDTGGQRYIDPFVQPDGTPTRKLIWHGGPGPGDPHQRGYDWAATPLHLLKFQGVGRWSVMLELFGISVPYVQYEGENYASDEDISAALSFLGMIGRGRPGLLSKKFGEVKITQPPAGIDARGQHAAIAGYVNSELSKLIQGQTLAMEIGGSGSYAAATVQADSKEEVQAIDARLASETWTHQLVGFLVEENMDALCTAFGATPEQVRACMPRAFRSVDRVLDPTAQLNLYVTAKEKLGVRLDMERVAEQLSLPVAVDEPQDDEEEAAAEPAQ